MNIAFRVLYISIVEGDRHILSLIMGGSFGQVVLPPRFTNVFHTTDLNRIDDDRVRFSLTTNQLGNGPRHLELGFLDE